MGKKKEIGARNQMKQQPLVWKKKQALERI